MQLNELRSALQDEFALALESTAAGNDISDDLCDEWGDYWQDVQDCGCRQTQVAYSTARDGIGCTAQQQHIILQYAQLVFNDVC